MPHTPPVVRLALAFAVGVSWGLLGAPLWTAPLLLVAGLAAPIQPSQRPFLSVWLLVALVGGLAGRGASESDGCASPSVGSRATLSGRFLASPRTGSAPFRPGDGCPTFTVVTADGAAAAGVPVTVHGRWTAGRRRPWLNVGEGGVVPVPRERAASFTELRWAPVRWRDGLVRRIERLYGARAPLVSALTLARREGMDADLRETFARTGIAHLLAISGFHVGVVAGLALTLLRTLGMTRRDAALGAAALAWCYVGLIGFPDAACRAALILALLAVSRAGGRPPARWGALAAAFLILLVLDPRRLAAPGFQLSFAGAAGLVAWSSGLTGAARRLSPGHLPDFLLSGLGAGVAATLATLPIVAWHFERVSLVGVPVTIAASPLVSLALPGALASIALDFVAPGAAAFVAGGVDLLLACLEGLTAHVSEWRWASAWTSRTQVMAAVAGVAVARSAARRPGVGARGRRALTGAYVGIVIVVWPVLLAIGGWRTLEVIAIDVGQGDAIAVRSPRGRWLLVDAGPPAPGSDPAGRVPRPGIAPDPGGHPVVRALRRRGVRRLEWLVLTHPDLDHIGGAGAVIASFEVGAIYDPALPAGKEDYVEVLAAAREKVIPWVAARAGQSFDFDGAVVEVLHPEAELGAAEANEASVVLRVRYGAFDVLLTGDAYKPTERRLAPELTGLEVVKLGHHGSDTSTDPELLERATPKAAIVSVGRFNRYGHPHPDVLARLEDAGVPLYRTDTGGTLSILGRADGSFSIRAERGGERGVFGSGGR